MKIKKKGSIYGLLCMAAILWVCAVPQKAAAEEAETDTIYEGIYLDNISIGGLSAGEAIT